MRADSRPKIKPPGSKTNASSTKTRASTKPSAIEYIKSSSPLRPPSPGAQLPSVTLIGFGNWGTVLAFALEDAGAPLLEIVTRGKSLKHRAPSPRHIPSAPIRVLSTARLDADVLWICAPDAAIAGIADKLAAALAARPRPERPVVFHSSGALASAELSALRGMGASVASVHPLMTFPPAARSQARARPLAGVPFAIEGDARACRAARKLVRAFGGDPFTLSARNKPLYHAFGAFASPLLVALLTAAARTAVAAGYTQAQAVRRMRPIVERTVFNFFENGPGDSFSGPIARGDAATVARHLQALRPYPRLRSAYQGLSRFALEALPAQHKRRIRLLLESSR